jgi:hypothetical protein
MPTKLSPRQIAAVNGKTTAGMAVAAVAYLLKELVAPLLDGAEFSSLITPEAIEVVLNLVIAAGMIFAGIFQRDADKSSQDNGARPAVKPEAVADGAAVDAEIARIRAGL